MVTICVHTYEASYVLLLFLVWDHFLLYSGWEVITSTKKDGWSFIYGLCLHEALLHYSKYIRFAMSYFLRFRVLVVADPWIEGTMRAEKRDSCYKKIGITCCSGNVNTALLFSKIWLLSGLWLTLNLILLLLTLSFINMFLNLLLQ